MPNFKRAQAQVPHMVKGLFWISRNRERFLHIGKRCRISSVVFYQRLESLNAQSITFVFYHIDFDTKNDLEKQRNLLTASSPAVARLTVARGLVVASSAENWLAEMGMRFQMMNLR
jgi:hypothetical protein